MLRFLLRRLLAGIVLIAVIATIGYFLLNAAAGNATQIVRNQPDVGPTASAATVNQRIHELGLDHGLLTRYFDWVRDAVHGNFGTSWSTGEKVTDAIFKTRLETTLSIVIGATVLMAIVAVFLGVLAARTGGWADRAVQVLALLGIAVPGFLIALALVAFFAIKLGWFEPTGYTAFSHSPSEWLKSVTLPIIALAIPGVAGVASQLRGSLLDTMRQDYVRTLRSRGLPERSVIYKHGLRNAAGPALSVLALQFIGLLGGTLFIEQIFAIPGIGQLAVAETLGGNIPVVMGVIVVTAVLVVIINLLVELLQAFLNPKVRLS